MSDPGPRERCEYEVDAPVRSGRSGAGRDFHRPCARPATGTWLDPNTGDTIRFCTQHRNTVTKRGYL